MQILLSWITSLCTRNAITYYLILIGISMALGILNNVFVQNENAVSWFGGQEVLEMPPEYDTMESQNGNMSND
jgi:hypothetical protein